MCLIREVAPLLSFSYRLVIRVRWRCPLVSCISVECVDARRCRNDMGLCKRCNTQILARGYANIFGLMIFLDFLIAL